MNERPDSCRLHGDLALRMARGLLELEQGLEAELTVGDCAHCSALLAGSGFAEVDAGVAAALDGIAAGTSRARRPVRQLAAAAAVAFVVGGAGYLSLSGVVRQEPADSPAEMGAPAARAIPEQEPTDAARPDVLFADGMESGDLGQWVVKG